MSRAGRHVRGERDTSWSRRVKLGGRGHRSEHGARERRRGCGELRVGGGALKWAVYMLEGRTVGEDGEPGLGPLRKAGGDRRKEESGGFWKDEPRGRRKGGRTGQSGVFL